MGSVWDDLEVAPVPGEAGRFTAAISDAWTLVEVPQGGIAAAIAARAMAHDVAASGQSLRSLSAVFAGKVADGRVDVEVTVLRRGRSMSQVAATVRNPGAGAGLTAVAVFGASRRGFSFTDLAFPDVPGPEGLRSFRDPLPDGVEFEFSRPPLPFWERILDARPAIGRPPWEPYEPGPAETAYWYRVDDPPVDADGFLDPLATLVMCDTMPGAVAQKIGPDQDWFGPSADFTFHVLDRARPGWLLGHNRARHAGDGYASVEMALWDPRGPTLVAYATQMMFFAFGV
jgi:Acyl-CoA thioesterase C-terminal domain/Acyl-CoA thioesterase N-terminal domain